jgi:hypothetical protein
MVDALHVAAKADDLAGVERYLRRQLRGGELSLMALRDHYGLSNDNLVEGSRQTG